jgi:hypothetical protein
MKRKRLQLALGGLVMFSWFVKGQVSNVLPQHFTMASPILSPERRPEVILPGNTNDKIKQELLDTNLIATIVKASHVSASGMKSILIAPDPSGLSLWLYQLNDDVDSSFYHFTDVLKQYVDGRLDGHTQKCLLAGLTNQAPATSITDVNLRIIISNSPLVPVSWLKMSDSGTRTNKEGQVVRRFSSFTIVDGEIGWRYNINYFLDGVFDSLSVARFDPCEIDPSLKGVFTDVDREVGVKMKQMGGSGQIGSIRTYWRLKKECLKVRGVEWRSPPELNPGSYD